MTRKKSFKEIECIWMESGYVNYKICENNFDCEKCQFDKAIHFRDKSLSQIQDNDLNKNSLFHQTFSELPDGFFLSKNHVWIKPIAEDEVEIGVDSYAQFLLKKMLSIQFPIVNNEIKSDVPVFWIIGTFGMLSIYSPFNGMVLEVNENIRKDFNSYKETNPYKAWLLKIKINFSELNFNEFVFNNNYHYFIDDEIKYLNDYFTNFRDKKLVGETLYDGGTLTDEIFHFLTDKEYIILLKTILNK